MNLEVSRGEQVIDERNLLHLGIFKPEIRLPGLQDFEPTIVCPDPIGVTTKPQDLKTESSMK